MLILPRAQSARGQERRRTLVGAATALLLATATLVPQVSAADPSPPAEEAVLLLAGNVGDCESSGDEATGRLLGELDGEIVALGDLAYPAGSILDYEACFLPAWGDHLDRMRGVVGNIDYRTPEALGFFTTFPEAAGPHDRGYYSFDAGPWHVVVVNTNCDEAQGCGEGSPQMAWLREDLARHAEACTLALGHHPRFSSGAEVHSTGGIAPLWDAFMEFGVDVVVAAHSHHYERFGRQTSDGVPDDHGPRLFVVGTGGRLPHPIGTRLATSEVAEGMIHGVLELRLREGDYSWRFVPAEGTTFTDLGAEPCVSVEPGLGAQLRSAAPMLLLVLPVGLVLLALLLRPGRYRVR